MTPTTTTIMKTFALKRAWTDAFVVYPETDDGASRARAVAAARVLKSRVSCSPGLRWLRARGQPDAISTALEGIAARLGTVAKTTKDAARAAAAAGAAVAPASPEPAAAAPAVEPTTEHVAPPPPAPRHAPTARRARRARAAGSPRRRGRRRRRRRRAR